MRAENRSLARLYYFTGLQQAKHDYLLRMKMSCSVSLCCRVYVVCLLGGSPSCAIRDLLLLPI